MVMIGDQLTRLQRHRHQYLWPNHKPVHRVSQPSQESPYSKPYHSYRRHRDNESFVVMSTKSSSRLTATGSDDRTKAVSNHSEGSRISGETRRLSATSGPHSPSKRTSERRLSSNGDITKKSDTNHTDPKNGDESTAQSATESNPKSGKSNARKGFLRGVVTTEQHDKQKSLLNTVRTHTRTRSESGQQAIDAPVVQTRVHSKKSSNDMNQLNASTDRARKTFAMPLPPN
ncbi:unnamed protein product, partial [Oppiella nova]